MITKKVLLEAICDLDKDVFSLATRVSELEHLLCKNKKPVCKEKTEKRRPGRPRKNAK